MKKITAALFILYSGTGYSVDYFTCTAKLEHEKLFRYIFSTDGHTAMERFVEPDAVEDTLLGFISDIDVKSINGSGDHYELNGTLPGGGHPVEINLVVDKDARGDFVGTYRRDKGVNEQKGNTTCRISSAIYRRKNDFNFFTYSKIPKGSLKCGENRTRDSFVINLKSKSVWGLLGQMQSGNYIGGEHFIANFKKRDENTYSVLSMVKNFGSPDIYQIKMELDPSSNEWKYSVTDFETEKTASGTCEIL